ncbi:MAG: hypothetical protein JJT76_19655 [Clostridiaceae bacterium]|nr:hypothetical protein [Clostridiaceae bacterium]
MSFGGGKRCMDSIMAKSFSLIKKRLWFIILVLFIIVILPSRKIINEDFRVYNYSNGIQEEDKTISFDISITRHNKIPFISKNHDVLFEVDGRKYRYVASNFPKRKETYIPLEMTIFQFGVLLPNKDFSEFIILFDENHHFDESNEIKFIVYPQRSELESMNLLRELLDYNNYDMERRPMY